jgi:hypothetical protein
MGIALATTTLCVLAWAVLMVVPEWRYRTRAALVSEACTVKAAWMDFTLAGLPGSDVGGAKVFARHGYSQIYSSAGRVVFARDGSDERLPLLAWLFFVPSTNIETGMISSALYVAFPGEEKAFVSHMANDRTSRDWVEIPISREVWRLPRLQRDPALHDQCDAHYRRYVRPRIDTFPRS